MSRAVTAIYRTHATASLVRDELERLGVSSHNITILPDRVVTADTSRSTASRTDFDSDVSSLHRLGLPDGDVQTYEQAIRNGDHVVSAQIADESQLARAQEVMQRPENNHDTAGTRAGHSGQVYDGTRTVAAVFDTEADAGDAVMRLRAAGIPERCIRVNPTASEQRDLQAYGDRHKRFHESIKDLKLPDEDARSFTEAMTRGAYLVTVHDFDGSMHDTVVRTLDHESTVDIDARESEWRSSGWTGHQDTSNLNTRGTIYDDGMQDRDVQMAADMGRRSQADLGSQQQGFAASGSMGQTGGYGTSGGASGGFGGDRVRDDGTVEVVEEELAVGKRAVERGAVRVRSYVREEPVSAEVDLRAERVFVERRPVDRPVREGDMRDQVLEARETTEEAVVSKQAHVVEEIGLRKETEVQHQTIQDTVRKTEVEIEDTRTGDSSRLTGDKDRY